MKKCYRLHCKIPCKLNKLSKNKRALSFTVAPFLLLQKLKTILNVIVPE